MIAGGIAAAVIVSGFVVTGALWGGATPAAAQEATALLMAASRTAAGEPRTPVKDGDYMYIRRVGFVAITTGSVTYRQPQVYEAWMPQDGGSNGHIRITYGAPQYLEAGDAQRVVAFGLQPPTPGSQRNWTIPPDQTPGDGLGNPSFAFLRTLPTDPDRLYTLISDYAQGRGVSQSQQMLGTVATLLSWSVAPPALRSALFEVAAHIPGIESRGYAVDVSGRSGTALAVTARGIRYEVIFDPRTAQLRGTREVLLNDATGRLPPGIVLEDEAITNSEVAGTDVPE